MTRTRSASLQGVEPVDADIDAETFKRVMLAVVQDLNMIFDIVTGQNTPTVSFPNVQPLTNDGTPYGGSLIGMPINIVQNARFLCFDDTATIGTDVYIACFPFFVPKGENFFTFEIETLDGGTGMTLEIYDGTGTLITPALTLEKDTNGENTTWRQYPQFAIDSTRYFFCVRAQFLSGVDYKEIVTARCVPSRVVAPVGYVTPQSVDGSTSIPVPTATGTTSLVFETIHDEMIADNFAMPGWVITEINRNWNALYECLCGGPVEGNAAVTNADSSSTNPATSRYVGHTLAGTELSTEQQIDLPLFAEAIGGARADGGAVVDNADPPVSGMTGWPAPYLRSVGSTDCKVHRNHVYIPDFPAGGSSKLNVSVLAVHDSSGGAKGTPTNQAAKITTSAGSTAFVGFTQLGTTPFYISEFAAVDFTPDAGNLFELHARTSSGAFTFGELALVGWAAWFDAH